MRRWVRGRGHSWSPVHGWRCILEKKEDSSWVGVRDKDIFSQRVNGRPSDEGARSVRSKQGKDSSSRTRRLE